MKGWVERDSAFFQSCSVASNLSMAPWVAVNSALSPPGPEGKHPSVIPQAYLCACSLHFWAASKTMDFLDISGLPCTPKAS